jgi:hypothetical protein
MTVLGPDHAGAAWHYQRLELGGAAIDDIAEDGVE